MKVLVLSTPEEKETASVCGDICRESGAEAYIHICGEDSIETLRDRYTDFRLLVNIWGRGIDREVEAVFSTGYFFGRGLSVVLFNPGKLDIPDYLEKSENIFTKENLRIFLVGEVKRQNRLVKMSDARQKIEDMGFEFISRDLVEAVSEGEILVVEQFMEAGFSPDVRDKAGVPILNTAARNGHRKIVTLLLDYGADINSVSNDRGNTPVMDASAEGQMEILSDLLGAGADPGIKSKSGQTALILAVGRQAEDEAVMLLEYGADPEVIDALGMSAIKYASLFGLKKVLAALENKSGELHG